MRVPNMTVAVTAVLIGSAHAAPLQPVGTPKSLLSPAFRPVLSPALASPALSPKGLMSSFASAFGLRARAEDSDDEHPNGDSPDSGNNEENDANDQEDSDDASNGRAGQNGGTTVPASPKAVPGGAAAANPGKATPTKAPKAPGSGGGGGAKGPAAPATTPRAPAPGSPATPGTGAGAGPGAGGKASPAGNGKLPPSKGTSALPAVRTIAAGQSFDGGMMTYDRGQSCTGQKEGGTADAVFDIMPGGSLSNVIIGPNQREGVHCQGACTLTNVWWAKVCEDAFTVKVQSATQTTTINGGGAFGATDKVIQHNGGGTIKVTGFTVGDFSKLYRACGNCKTSAARHVIMSGITATNGDMLAGINPNFGDTAKITGTKATAVKEMCVQFNGVKTGTEPTKLGAGQQNAAACSVTA